MCYKSRRAGRHWINIACSTATRSIWYKRVPHLLKASSPQSDPSGIGRSTFKSQLKTGMAAKKEVDYLLLDVSASMRPYLDLAARCIADLVESKVGEDVLAGQRAW
jgi:hypothetical protein